MAVAQVSSDLERQRSYTRMVKAKGLGFGLTVADAFVRGIRDLGYRSTATALRELVDNSIQAESENVLVLFGYENRSVKPTKLAIVDDGHGMDPDMVRMSVIWGGTHREGDRSGFGRYGYGLPSSCVSMGRRFTVYSLVEGGQLHAVTLDLDDIAAGKYNNSKGQIEVPPARPATMPEWIAEEIVHHHSRHPHAFHQGSPAHGTVVVIEKLDRLAATTRAGLFTHLVEDFGVTYRNYLQTQVNLSVDAEPVEPVDPLFLTPGYAFYDLDEDRADSFIDPVVVAVKDPDTKETVGAIQVRYAYLPPTFGRREKQKVRGGTNERNRIMGEHIGIIVMRNGRQLDVVQRNPWFRLGNNDRNWGVELDFPAELDEEFAVTTAKQQVTISERVWKLLEQAGVRHAIERLRRRYSAESDQLKLVEEQHTKSRRTAEEAAAAAEKLLPKRTGGDIEARRVRGAANLEKRIAEEVERTGEPEPAVRERLWERVERDPFRVDEESLPGAPFFRVELVGPQRVLYLNREHRWYQDIYAARDVQLNPRYRAALELMLMAFGKAQLDANSDEAAEVFNTAMHEWSQNLRVMLNQLDQIDSLGERVGTASASDDEDAP